MDATKVSAEVVESIISAMGWEDGKDKAPFIARLEGMDVNAALGKWALYELGDANWARAFLRVQSELTQAVRS